MLRMLAPVAALALIGSPALALSHAGPAGARTGKTIKHQHVKVTKTAKKAS